MIQIIFKHNYLDAARHWVDDPNVLLVHVTPFNALMWDSGGTPTRVIDHGVLPLQTASYSGHVARGIVVVNNLQSRGRRLGLDVYRQVAERVPLTLYGMGSEAVGGAGEVQNDRLPGVMAAHRFFFNPIRYTSLPLSLCEAMAAGCLWWPWSSACTSRRPGAPDGRATAS